MADLGCAAVAASLDDELAIDLSELERDLFTRCGDARAEGLERGADGSRLPAQKLGNLYRQFPGNGREIAFARHGEAHFERRRIGRLGCGTGHWIRFYSEMRPNSRRAPRQSASIWARSASTSGKARSSRSRCTNARRSWLW